MKKYLFLVGLLFSVIFTGCGGGGGSSSSQGANQGQLGPLINATVNAYRLTDLATSIETTTTNSNTSDLDIAGTFDLKLNGISNDEWILVTVSGGEDIDANDDNVIDSIFTTNNGTIYALSKKEDLTNGSSISPISDIVYKELINQYDITTLNSSQISTYISQIASNWLSDVNGDNIIDYKDINKFKPRNDKEKSKVSWEFILDNYISSIHSNQSSDKLLEKIQLIKSTSAEGFTQNSDTSSKLVKSIENEKVIVKAIDTTDNGNANRVVIEQIKDNTFSSTQIYQNESGDNGVVYKVTNSFGDTLTIIFNGTGNLLTTLEENDLQNLVNSGRITFSEIEKNGNKKIILNFPKEIMQSWSATDLSLKFNDTYIKKEYLEVIDDDPLIAWDIKPIPPSIEYEIPTGGTEIIFPQYYIKNTGGIKFYYRDYSTCLNNEVEILQLDSVYEGTISNSEYRLCAEHGVIRDEVYLDNQDGTKLFSYDANSGKATTKTIIASSIKEVYLGTKSTDYEIITKISATMPTDDSLDGWSSPLSFESIQRLGYIGDYEYTTNRLWIAIKDKRTTTSEELDYILGDWECNTEYRDNIEIGGQEQTCSNSSTDWNIYENNGKIYIRYEDGIDWDWTNQALMVPGSCSTNDSGTEYSPINSHSISKENLKYLWTDDPYTTEEVTTRSNSFTLKYTYWSGATYTAECTKND